MKSHRAELDEAKHALREAQDYLVVRRRSILDEQRTGLDRIRNIRDQCVAAILGRAPDQDLVQAWLRGRPLVPDPIPGQAPDSIRAGGIR